MKLKRGRADKPLNFTEEDYLEKINIFFNVNDYNTRKIQFIKKRLNLSEKIYQKLKLALENKQ